MESETKKQTWSEANKWEQQWHGDCINSYNEETKQYIYAHFMGLDLYATNHYGQRGWDFGNQSVMDIGGGPYSLLLKARAKAKFVVDPCLYPPWVQERYEAAEITFLNIKAEDINPTEFFNSLPEIVDECIIYNCLQHTEDPALIINNCLRRSKVIRLFEWIDEPISPGHIHTLTAGKLTEWLGAEGKTLALNQGPCVGSAYAGIFPGNHWDMAADGG